MAHNALYKSAPRSFTGNVRPPLSGPSHSVNRIWRRTDLMVKLVALNDRWFTPTGRPSRGAPNCQPPFSFICLRRFNCMIASDTPSWAIDALRSHRAQHQAALTRGRTDHFSYIRLFSRPLIFGCCLLVFIRMPGVAIVNLAYYTRFKVYRHMLQRYERQR